MTYSDDRPGGNLIESKNRLASWAATCEICEQPLGVVDINAALSDVKYRAKCEVCGAVHAFVQLNGVLIIGVPSKLKLK